MYAGTYDDGKIRIQVDCEKYDIGEFEMPQLDVRIAFWRNKQKRIERPNSVEFIKIHYDDQREEYMVAQSQWDLLYLVKPKKDEIKFIYQTIKEMDWVPMAVHGDYPAHRISVVLGKYLDRRLKEVSHGF